jgi:hypothetical protein
MAGLSERNKNISVISECRRPLLPLEQSERALVTIWCG